MVGVAAGRCVRRCEDGTLGCHSLGSNTCPSARARDMFAELSGDESRALSTAFQGQEKTVFPQER